MNKLIALVGEDPNDTSSIKNLLVQKFKEISYVTLIKNKRGNQLDNERTKIALEIEYNRKKPFLIVFIRDADGLATHKHKIEKCINWFTNLSKEITCKKILLLNVYELEALIFADIATFNRIYKTNIKNDRDVTFIDDPKGELENETSHLPKKYAVSHCPELFKQIRIEIVIQNCSFFRKFVKDFSDLLKDK